MPSRQNSNFYYSIQLVISVFCLLAFGHYKAQNNVYKQFWNEFQFTHPLNNVLAVEIDLASSFSNTPDDRSRLTKFTQFAGTGQLHYFLSAKWKLTFLTAYFTNSYVPEIGQREYPEYRFSAQAVYYINKIKNITATRGRLEYRLIENSVGKFEDVLRYRQMFKFTKPLNSNYIRSGTYFAYASEEVFFKLPADITGPDIFDRNMFSFGIGYSFTDDLQIDIGFTNEYIPREGGNTINNAMLLNLTLNNPFGHIERIFHPTAKP